MSDALRELAEAYGVATAYWDTRNEHVHVASETLIAVLRALDVDASTPDACRAALHDKQNMAWQRMLPPCVVTREDEQRTVEVHVTDGAPLEVWITLEGGSYHGRCEQLENNEPPREIDGRLLGEATFEVPLLPPGYHRLHARSNEDEQDAALIVTPARINLPARLGDQPVWGLATQLYSVRSHQSWGVGDLTDLTDLATWSAVKHGADYVLINPVHAAEPVAPMQPSPYLPTTRRFPNPLYLRVERIPEYATLDIAIRWSVDVLRQDVDNNGDLIDRDKAWRAKRAALQIVHRQPRTAGRELAYRAFCRREGRALDDFAVWCALTEQHGSDWHDWPEQYRHPRAPEVDAFAAEHATEADFYRWLQWLLDEQLAAAHSSAQRAGMRLGVMHDLAVGVSATGADSWARQDELAGGVTVGAPPDPYAQTGQNWEQPPWRPDRLAELEYGPLRDLVANTLRHSGGLRIDHIIGLFRLWWIPAGASPTQGTYVRYDHDATIGILALEAQRADAVIVGEDLGTVEPWVRDYLRARGLLGTSVLWFELDYDGGGGPLAPERWREYCLASVTTHDLPPSAGYLAGDHVRLRNDLGLLTRSLDEELAAHRVEQDAWLTWLRERGLLADDADPDETVLALHRALRQAPARLRSLALTDAVGDRRTQNQPGATEGYPNWRIPLGGPDGRPLFLEDVFTSGRAARLAEIVRGR